MAISRQRYLLDNSVNANGVYYIDLWRNTSIQERKLFPQMRVCNVMGGLIKDSNNDSVVRVNVAPDTWVTRTAIRRGFNMWNKMLEEGTEGLEGGIKVVKPKYHDFKVLLNTSMSATTSSVVASSPNVMDASGVPLPTGEWVYSKFISEDIAWDAASLTSNTNRDADEFRACIVGGEHNAGAGGQDIWQTISLTKSWLDSRPSSDLSGEPYTTSSDALSADPLVNLFDEADTSDEIITMLQDYNDRPPYHETDLFGTMPNNPAAYGDNLQRVAFAATQSGAGQVSALNGFSAICGLIQVQVTQGSAGVVELLLDVNTKGAKV